MTDVKDLVLEPGLWHPDAAITCAECHTKRYGASYGFGSSKLLDDEVFEARPHSEKTWECGVGVCDICGKQLWLDVRIAAEQKVAAELVKRGFVEAQMMQTGGMCSAAGIWIDHGVIDDWGHDSDDGAQIMVTWDEDNEEGGDKFIVGLYIYTADDDEDKEDWKGCLGFDAAVEQAIKYAEASRHA